MQYTYEQLLGYLKQYGSKSTAARSLHIPRRSFGHLLIKAEKNGIAYYSPHKDSSFFEDEEIIEQNVKYKRQAQKFQDINRIERKSFREYSREYNAIEEYNKNLIELLKKHAHTLPKCRFEKTSTAKSNAVGVIHLTDTHFNEMINIPGNKYDFEVASRRLKKLADSAKVYFEAKGINSVLIAITADLLNSNRRYDELLTQATNRAKATLMSVFLLEQFILDLSHKFEVSVTGVTGNESRAEKELGYSDIVASDNYDFTIFNILKIVFRDNKNVRFFKCDKLEQVVKFNNCNILLVHGLSMKADLDKSVQQMIGKYASKGISIDFVFFGHIHSCSIGDFYARGSSLCGANAYSDYGLNLQSRASQNLAIFYSDKGHDVIKIDLQNTDGICGYDISKSLIENDVRRLSQNSPHKDIIEIR